VRDRCLPVTREASANQEPRLSIAWPPTIPARGKARIRISSRDQRTGCHR